MIQLRKFPDPKSVAEECAQQILEWLDHAISANGFATLAISGGSSPRAIFELFAAKTFDWNRVHLFWVDERCVPVTDSQSNFKFTKDTWLDPGNFPKANIHRVRAELPPTEAAALYTKEIRETFQLTDDELPKFDVIHRGMGPDAHTASLFPGELAIDNKKDIAAAVWVEKFKQWRVTLLPGVLASARHTAMLVVGADKEDALKNVLEGSYDPQKFPAQIASRNGAEAIWFVDKAAAGSL